MSDEEKVLVDAFGKPTEKQSAFLKATARYVGYGGAKGGGKLLSVDTPIPTVDGWKRMGDIEVGDVLFDEKGRQCRVTDVFPAQYDKTYKLNFSDGSEIIAGASHSWVTETAWDRVAAVRRTAGFRTKKRAIRPKRGIGKRLDLVLRSSTRKYEYLSEPQPAVKTTQEIADTLFSKNTVNHSIRVCGAIDTSERALPVPPYVLGAWLGDGSTTSADITGIDEEIFDNIKALGYTVTDYTNKRKGISGLQTQLKAIGVFGNKHIPNEYLRSSIQQRTELLNGLMDTDGTCDASGQCEFYNTNKRLIENIHELICSLGIKATIRVGRAKLYGKDCGEKYRIKFMCNFSVFKLTRKSERQKLDCTERVNRRYIVDAIEITPVLMRCIAVDSPSHLYLAGKSFIPTHNSHAVRTKSTYLAFAYPGIQMLIVRRSHPELRENHVNRLLSAYSAFPEDLKPRYSDDEKAFTFPWGSRLKLGYCDSEHDVLQYQGQEYDVLFVDEATQLTENQFGWLDACVRGTKRFPKRTYITCNPGGVGHAWVKRLFIDREYIRSERAEDYIFIQALVWDNGPLFEGDAGYRAAMKSLKKQYGKEKTLCELKELAKRSAGYVRRLENLPKELRRAWLDGDWNVFAGQFFGEFKEEAHVCEPFEVPEGWRRSASLDYGLDMLAVLWFAVGPDGQTYCYRSMEKSGLTVSAAASAIREAEAGETVQEHIAPPDLWSRRQDSGRSAADIFAECGVPLVKAGNSRIDGWLCVKEYLKAGEGKPKMMFFSSCHPILRALPRLQHDGRQINDAATEPHDLTHSPDALRYWCSRRQMSPAMSAPEIGEPFARKRNESGEVNEDYLLGGYGAT